MFNQHKDTIVITYCEIFRVINNTDEPGMTAVEPKGKKTNRKTNKQNKLEFNVTKLIIYFFYLFRQILTDTT